MRTRLSMFDEVLEGDHLEVGVVVDADGTEVFGYAGGSRLERLELVARASIDCARHASLRHPQADYLGMTLSELNGSRIITVMVGEEGWHEPLVGAAVVRAHEDEAKATIRAVFDALNRRFDL